MTNPSMVWLDWPDANRGAIVFDEPPENEYQAGQTRYRRADLPRGEDIARIAALERALRDALREAEDMGWAPGASRLADAREEAARDTADEIAALIRGIINKCGVTP